MGKRKSISLPPEPAPVAKTPRLKLGVHLSAIYSKDVLSFLTHTQLQPAREVSSKFKEVGSKVPACLAPRRRLHALIVTTDARSTFDEDGYLEEVEGVEWRKVHRSMDCFKKLANPAFELVNELICPSMAADQAIRICVQPQQPSQRQSRQLVYSAQNRMSLTSAFGLLHLLGHLHGTVLFRLCIDIGLDTSPTSLDEWSDDAEGVLNPKIFTALSTPGRPQFKLHSHFFQSTTSNVHRIARFTPSMAQTLSAAARARSVCSTMEPSYRNSLLSFVLTGGHRCKTMQFNLHQHDTPPVTKEFVGEIVKFFTDAPDGLSAAVPETLFKFNPPIKSWPIYCFPATAREVVCEKYGETHCFEFENNSTGEKFEVRLSCQRNPRSRANAGLEPAFQMIKLNSMLLILRVE